MRNIITKKKRRSTKENTSEKTAHNSPVRDEHNRGSKLKEKKIIQMAKLNNTEPMEKKEKQKKTKKPLRKLQKILCRMNTEWY